MQNITYQEDKLKCESCGEKSCIILTKKQLLKHVSGLDSAGTPGIICKTDIKKIFEIFKILLPIICKTLVKKYESNQQNYVVCLKCGYYEKI